MTKRLKTGISLLLALALVAGMFAIAPLTAFADGDTTEPATDPEAGDTYIVAGTPADIFGTAWDAANDANVMTDDGNGKFTKDYTVEKAYDAVQLKVVKNGAEWIGDNTGNNVTFNLTGAGTFTVAIDTETNDITVTGDNVEFITEMDYDTVFAVGNGEGWWLNGSAWDPAFASNEMTEVAEDVWEIEFPNVPDGFERQVKFAIDGAWTHNFGGAYDEDLDGEPQDAVYNGDNITFDTYDDSQTVKLQLDLRDFDFSTKEGAKFTITIVPDGEEEETTEFVEDTTSAPEETTEAVEETTAPPEQPTEPATEPATDPAEAAPFTVTATSNYFPETSNTYYDFTEFEDENGDAFITVEYKMLADQMYIVNIDVGELTYDPNVLEWRTEYNLFGNIVDFFPFAAEYNFGAGALHQTEAGRIVGNYSSVQPAAWAYNEDGSAVTVVKAVFKVLDRNAAATTVNLNVEYLAMCDEAQPRPYVQYQVIAGGVINSEVDPGATLSTVIGPASQEPPAPPVVILVGDVNNDGEVTVDDATLLQQFFAEFTTDEGEALLDIEDEETFTRADANRDGDIDIRDVTQIQRYVAEFIEAL